MKWLTAAVDYLPRWHRIPDAHHRAAGLCDCRCVQGKVVFEAAFRHGDLPRGIALTPSHRFRVASRSKTFTAAALMKLREKRKLQLDHPVGKHVSGLRADVGALTLATLTPLLCKLLCDVTLCPPSPRCTRSKTHW